MLTRPTSSHSSLPILHHHRVKWDSRNKRWNLGKSRRQKEQPTEIHIISNWLNGQGRNEIIFSFSQQPHKQLLAERILAGSPGSVPFLNKLNGIGGRGPLNETTVIISLFPSSSIAVPCTVTFSWSAIIELNCFTDSPAQNTFMEESRKTTLGDDDHDDDVPHKRTAPSDT